MSKAAPNDQVRAFWEQEPCGTNERVTGALDLGSRDWFEAVEANRYACEPMIHAAAQFTRHDGKRLLEIGVGCGDNANINRDFLTTTDAFYDSPCRRKCCVSFKSG